MLNENEKGNFEKLLLCTHSVPNGIYEFFDNTGASIKASYDTDYETDNGMEPEDANYEEFFGIVFKRLNSGNMFEITYKNLPSKATCDGVTIYE